MNPGDVFAGLLDVGKHVLSAGINAVTKVITYQIGNAFDGTADSDSVEAFGPPGYYAIPANPTDGGDAVETIVVKSNGHDSCIGTRDIRDAPIYGNLKPGDRCIAGGFPAQNRFLQKANGDQYLFTTLGNVAGGQNLVIRQGADGAVDIRGALAFLSFDTQGNITLGNAACGLTMNAATGTVQIFGKVVQLQASGICQVSGDKMTALGPTPTLATACAMYPVVGTLPPPSTNVFVSPVGK